MKKLVLLALAIPAMALAQSYPAPTFNSVILQNPLSPANGGTGATSATGTGSVVLSNSPALTSPALGTPSAVTLTNGTGLPITTGVSGLGVGVAAGLTNAATGSGGPVLATSPTITNPTITGGTVSGLLSPIPLASGGTNATTASAALTNLGAFPASGGTLTGNATVSATNASVTLNDTSGSGAPGLLFSESGITKWVLVAQADDLAFQLPNVGNALSISNSTGAVSLGFGLSVSGAVSGSGFSNYLSSPPPIGSTTPASGAFTNLTANGTVSGSGFTNLLSPYATLYSPALSGTPSAPTAAAHTNSTQIATTAFVASDTPCPSIMDNGGNNTDSGDNSAAFAATAALGPAGQACVYFPPGTYDFSSQIVYTLPSTTAAISIAGAGSGVTRLNFTGSAAGSQGIEINLISQFNAFHISGLTLTTNAAANSDTAIAINQTAASSPNPANSAQSDITDVAIQGADAQEGTDYWNYGVNIYGASNVNLTKVSVSGSSAGTGGIGLNIYGTSSNIPVVFNVQQCTFNNVGTAIDYGNYAQGITVNQTNITGGQTGIYAPPSSTALDQLTVSNSQIATYSNTINLASSTGIPNVMIVGNLLSVLSDNVSNVQLSNAGELVMVGNSITGPSATASNTNGIAISSSAGKALITGNSFFWVSTGIVTSAGTSGINIQSNIYAAGVGTPVNNMGGSGNTVGGGSP